MSEQCGQCNSTGEQPLISYWEYEPAELLEIPEFRAMISPISVEEYHQLPYLNERGRKTELIEGFVIEKMPKSPLHASITTLIGEILLPQTPTGFILRQDQPLTLRASEPEPDIAIVRGGRKDFFEHHPTTASLVIEIAVTSLSLDREKARLYAEAGVEEYWIILAKELRAEIYRDPKDGRYLHTEIVESSAVLQCSSLPDVELALGELVG